MTTALPSSDFIRLPMEALKPVCATLGAHLFVATTLRAALDALFDGPAGSLVILVPGAELPESDSAAGEQIDELQMWRESISIVVSHRLPPTSTPSQALYEAVGGAQPFIDLVAAVRDAMRALRMPTGSTGRIWRYEGRKPVDFSGIPMPAFQLDFSIEATPPYEGGSPDIADPFEETEPPQEP